MIARETREIPQAGGAHLLNRCKKFLASQAECKRSSPATVVVEDCINVLHDGHGEEEEKEDDVSRKPNPRV